MDQFVRHAAGEAWEGDLIGSWVSRRTICGGGVDG